jgi:hypothetical protein
MNLKRKNRPFLSGCLAAGLLLVMALTSCKKDKTASPDNTNSPAEEEKKMEACFKLPDFIRRLNELTYFENCSKHYERCEWDFGNGGGSTFSEPATAWANKGYFPVSLTVFKGTEHHKVTRRVLVVEHGVRIEVTLAVSGWKTLPPEYNTLAFVFSKYKSSDTTQPVGMPVYYTFHTIHQHPPQDTEFIMNEKEWLSDGTKMYRGRLELLGVDKDDSSITYPLEELFVTGDIDLIEGPYVSTGTITSSQFVSSIGYTVGLVID